MNSGIFFPKPRTGGAACYSTSGTSPGASATGRGVSDDNSSSESESSSDGEDSEITAYDVFLIRVCMF
jgi:hypothetical protein